MREQPPDDGRKKEVTAAAAAVIEVSSIVIQLVMRRSLSLSLSLRCWRMIASEILVSQSYF